MTFLVEIMRRAARTGDVDTVAEILVAGDKALERGPCADPDLITELVATANKRLAELAGQTR